MFGVKFMAHIEQGEDRWLVGQIKEVPDAISQGKTIEELTTNLINALKLVLDTDRELYICI